MSEQLTKRRAPAIEAFGNEPLGDPVNTGLTSTAADRGPGAPSLADALAARRTELELEVVEAYLEAALSSLRRGD